MKLKKEQQITDDLSDIFDSGKALQDVISKGKADTESSKPIKPVSKRGRPPAAEPTKACSLRLSLRVIQLMDEHRIGNKSTFVDILITNYFKSLQEKEESKI